MKKVFCLFCLMLPFIVKGVDLKYIRVEEPDWIGEGVIVIDSVTTIPLEKSIADVRTKDQFLGPTKKLYVKGRYSSVRMPEGTIQIIIKVENNNIDPMSVVRIFKFSGRRNRDAIISRLNDLTGTVSYNKFKKVDFSAKRYGESSYLITIENLEKGEYGITVGDPDVNKTLVVSAFGVDENENGTKSKKYEDDQDDIYGD